MGIWKDIWLIIMDFNVILWVFVGIGTWIKFGLFYNEYPIPFIGAIGQLAWFYICIRIRTISELISQERIYQFNFYGLLYSILNSVYGFIILLFSYKDK